MPKIQRNQNDVTSVNIPKSKAQLAGLRPGDEVDFNFNQDGDLVMTKIKK